MPKKKKFDLSSVPEAILGGSYDDLKNQGAKLYPNIPPGSQHHALAAERAAEIFGFIPAQVLGLGVEAYEHLPLLTGGSAPQWQDTLNDLRANVIGGARGGLARLGLARKRDEAPIKSYQEGTLDYNAQMFPPSYQIPAPYPEGMIAAGNIDLYSRPDVSGSTVRSISFGEDGKEILIPTVVGGKIVSDEDAIKAYRQTGQHLGMFTNPKRATEYAKKLHEDYGAGRIPVKSGGKAIKSYQEGTMPMTSNAGYEPGRAYASQSPYQVPSFSGGSGSGMFKYMNSMLERQMRLKEAMAKAQLEQMQQQRRAAEQQMEAAKKRYQIEGDTLYRQTRPKMGLSGGGRPASSAERWQYEVAPRMMAEALHSPMATPGMQDTMKMISSIGVPAAHEGMMQSGQILGQLGAASLAGAKGYLQPQGGGQQQQQLTPEQQEAQMRLRLGRTSFGGPMGGSSMGSPMGGIQGGIPASSMGWLGTQAAMGPPNIPGRYAEKGGRVPKTGTYKLHKGEVVLNKGQSDMMFPKPPMPAKGKPIKSYKDGSFWDVLSQILERQQDPTALSLPGIEPRGTPITSGKLPIPTYGYEPKRYYGPEGFVGPQQPVAPSYGPEGFVGPQPQAGFQPIQPIEGLTVTEDQMSEPRSVEFGGRSIQMGVPPNVSMAGPKPPQQTVKNYELTGKPETEEERIRRFRDKSDRAAESAELQRSRAELLLSYADKQSELDPAVKRAYQERMWKAQEYDKVSADALKKAEEADAKMKEVQVKKDMIEAEKDIAGVESTGRVDAEKIKQLGDAREFQMRKAAELPKDMVDVLNTYRKNALEDEGDAEDTYIAQVHALFGWFKPLIQSELDVSPEAFKEMFDDLIAKSLEDPTQLELLISRIQQALGR